MKRLSFRTQFKIEFLLQFTGCRKVLGKMPVNLFHCCGANICNTKCCNKEIKHSYKIL